ncbi:thermonuclease family protein [Candidatus Parcubacteria bacterium]|nr:thermonuclease family protein [Candidatus Parcubacteria bacterium]
MQMNKFFQTNQKFIIAFISSLVVIIFIYLLSNLLFVGNIEFDNSNFEPEQGELYQIVKVIDGDTVVVRRNSQDEIIRLIGINTPEIVDPNRPVECFGAEASSKAKEILSGKNVRLEKDKMVNNVDKYGRSLRYIFFEDGTNFSKVMIEGGYAYEYTYQNETYGYQDEFKSAENLAREAKRGLWSDDACEG